MDKNLPAANPAHRYYAGERWANAVLTVVSSSEDPKTIEHWGRLVGASRGTLVTWCRAAHVPPRRSLELARLLRALRLTDGNVADIQDVMDIVEPRTIKRLIARCGISSDRCGSKDFLVHQALVRQPKALALLDAALTQTAERS
jgi:hypothetical protein